MVYKQLHDAITTMATIITKYKVQYVDAGRNVIPSWSNTRKQAKEAI